MAITALIDTNVLAAPIQPFSDRLQLIDQPAQEPHSPFGAFFDAAMGMVNDTNRMQLEARQFQFDFATGRLDDILAVQMAMDRASNALTFTTQVTNRIIEAYREIMRMQI
ncbi:MAG: flagellar hook-basal body complex protein FliE [Defluviitaleaceae bacterium]|nr:flagellar hook-basal body complex protein FliE [Defluviitaleaceae bacterium]